MCPGKLRLIGLELPIKSGRNQAPGPKRANTALETEFRLRYTSIHVEKEKCIKQNATRHLP